MSNLLIFLMFSGPAISSTPTMSRCEKAMTELGRSNRPISQWLSHIAKHCQDDVPLLARVAKNVMPLTPPERNVFLAVAAMEYLPEICEVENLAGTALDVPETCPRAKSLWVVEEIAEYMDVGFYLTILALDRKWGETDRPERRQMHRFFTLSATNYGFDWKLKRIDAMKKRTTSL